jgi:Mlc titration factor MtfA (ptsG expression regulator)
LPFPEPWIRILRKNFRFYDRLSDREREVLCHHIQVILAEKRFEGCGGFEITDEVRVTIAAWACLLLIGRETDYYPGLTSILVYPSAYIARGLEYGEDGVMSEFEEDRSGETWEKGSLVISWDEALYGGDLSDGYNVVLHEFAHQLDLENGAIDGVPKLESAEHYQRWQNVFGDAFRTLRFKVEHGVPSVIDDYGASDPTELFAVATESFFERPRALEREFPPLYKELETYYRLDPTAWELAP